MGKSAKKTEKRVNFVPGWIGGRLTSPAAYDKSALKKLERRLAVLSQARELARAKASEHDAAAPITFG